MDTKHISEDGHSSKQIYDERKETKLREREDTKGDQKRTRTGKRIARYVVTLAVIFLVGYGVVLIAKRAGPQGEDLSQSVPIQGREHIDVGGTHPQYNSNPPSSGWHHAQPARSGFYDEPLPDEQVIHNLEHGGVWIAYRPTISEENVQELETFARDLVVIITPRETNDADIALVAWGRIDTFNVEGALDTERISNFIKRYRNKGPERVPPSAHR